MTGRSKNNASRKTPASRPVFPFTAIVGQEEMKLALLLNVVAPSIGGVLVTGHRGTGKSTAVRALADLLPPLAAVRDCAYNCDPSDAAALCDDCRARLADGAKLARARRSVPVVELPLGATEDRVCGTIDLGRALSEGVKRFEPGLLARANRGFLYIDEVNLLEDHLVDLLLDVAATGRNLVEREGVSAEHPARFVLVGSGNPEEGELRPQLLDRFGLCAEVETTRDLDERVLIVEHREAFDQDPDGFLDARQAEQTSLRRRVLRAARAHARVEVTRALLRSIAELCQRLGVDGHRGEITVTRAARALAAFEGRRAVTFEDVRRVAPMSLRHRLRRDPLESGGGEARVRRCISEIFGDTSTRQGGEKKKSRLQDDKGFEVDGPRGDGSSSEFDFSEVNSGGSHARSQEDGDPQRRSPQGRSPEGERQGGNSLDGGELIIPAAEVGLSRDVPTKTHEAKRQARSSKSASRRRAGARRSPTAGRGRYAGASADSNGARGVAFDATLRAAAPARALKKRDAAGGTHGVAPEDLRFKRYSAKAGALYVFVVDASGSMAANRIGQAKGVLAQLLRRSYVNRDRVSLISFRERGAELLLAPSGSASRARRLLEELPVGGATPLAAGLLRALDVSRRAASDGACRVKLIVFTDGRANVPLSEGVTAKTTALDGRDNAVLKKSRDVAFKEQIKDEIRRLGASLSGAGVASLVIDTRSRFTANGEGRFLSESLDGRYLQLPQLISGGELAEALRDADV
ncbi:MAG TPA: magnesium chelatase ATPase subunit I [Pyrinomonadaceae bacterium]|jgi:magnesium chelatase subunit D|nr:magnesium chelatase ATPase subunit I [Pyrinomonadaceae bacterium]